MHWYELHIIGSVLVKVYLAGTGPVPYQRASRYRTGIVCLNHLYWTNDGPILDLYWPHKGSVQAQYSLPVLVLCHASVQVCYRAGTVCLYKP